MVCSISTTKLSGEDACANEGRYRPPCLLNLEWDTCEGENEELDIRRSFDIRANEEIKKLIREGRQLIGMLKENYHFE